MRTDLSFNQPTSDTKHVLVGWPAVSYTFPITYNKIDSNGNFISGPHDVWDWDREYKVKVVSYESNDPSVKCEAWVNDAIKIRSYNASKPSICLTYGSCEIASDEI